MDLSMYVILLSTYSYLSKMLFGFVLLYIFLYSESFYLRFHDGELGEVVKEGTLFHEQGKGGEKHLPLFFGCTEL